MATTNPATPSSADIDDRDSRATVTAADTDLLADSFGEYVQAQWKRIKNGESGALPVVAGLILIIVVFQIENSKFLSAGNLTNLIEQSGVFILLGMAEVFVLLLGEIDLSVGYVAGVGATITAQLATSPHNMNWFLASVIGIAACAVIGLIQGLLITRLGLPSFVVTLGGLLGWEGFLLYLIQRDKYATGGVVNVTSDVLNDIVNGSLSPAAGWIVMVVAVLLYAAVNVLQAARRRSSGLKTAPVGLMIMKIAAVAVFGVVVVVICNRNRGLGLVTLNGVPWIAPLLIVVLIVYSTLLSRMRFGRHLYAIGGNAEAARRAGINVNAVRLLAFVLGSTTAGIAGIDYLSAQGSVSSGIDGGNLVLYAVAAAVIGGTSLFGGRGKMVHAVLGGLIIATVYNGMGLLGLSAAAQFMVTALVLVAAVVVDALSSRNRSTR